MIGDRRLLFSDQFQMEADFGNVAGVEIGTDVRLSGLPAGEVIGIDIPDAPGGRFVVRMRVREDRHTLVRTDSEAAILSDGLLGSAFIQLRAGTGTAPLVPDGGALRGVAAVLIADLITEGQATFRTAADEIVQMRVDVLAGRRPAVRDRSRRRPAPARDGADRRIAEAMGQLLQYPRISPIVVEGYATAGETGRRLLDSQARAEMVESHLVRTFRRAGATGTMALGAQAAESPSRDGRWDGVALVRMYRCRSPGFVCGREHKASSRIMKPMSGSASRARRRASSRSALVQWARAWGVRFISDLRFSPVFCRSNVTWSGPTWEAPRPACRPAP